GDLDLFGCLSSPHFLDEVLAGFGVRAVELRGGFVFAEKARRLRRVLHQAAQDPISVRRRNAVLGTQSATTTFDVKVELPKRVAGRDVVGPTPKVVGLDAPRRSHDDDLLPIETQLPLVSVPVKGLSGTSPAVPSSNPPSASRRRFSSAASRS